jgi:hypothetical protein
MSSTVQTSVCIIALKNIWRSPPIKIVIGIEPSNGNGVREINVWATFGKSSSGINAPEQRTANNCTVTLNTHTSSSQNANKPKENSTQNQSTPTRIESESPANRCKREGIEMRERDARTTSATAEATIWSD